MDQFAKSKDSTLVKIQLDLVTLVGNMSIPEGSHGIVLFAHGSGSSRMSPRNRYVARLLNQNGIATLLFDLLTRAEEEIDYQTSHLRFDIALLSQRLVQTTDWLLGDSNLDNFSIGYFGASTGAAAALVGAAARPEIVKAVVSRGGRPDLAGSSLGFVKCPTLLLVGGYDDIVLDLNKQAFDKIKSEKKLIIIPELPIFLKSPEN